MQGDTKTCTGDEIEQTEASPHPPDLPGTKCTETHPKDLAVGEVKASESYPELVKLVKS
jgi:hypothetical protein